MKLQESPPGLEPCAEGLSPTAQAGHATFAAGRDSPMAPPMIGSRSSWAARFFGWISPRGARPAGGRGHGEVPREASGQGDHLRLRGSDPANPTMRSMA